MEARDKIRSKGFYFVLGDDESRLSSFSVRKDKKSIADDKSNG